MKTKLISSFPKSTKTTEQLKETFTSVDEKRSRAHCQLNTNTILLKCGTFWSTTYKKWKYIFGAFYLVVKKLNNATFSNIGKEYASLEEKLLTFGNQMLCMAFVKELLCRLLLWQPSISNLRKSRMGSCPSHRELVW